MSENKEKDLRNIPHVEGRNRLQMTLDVDAIDKIDDALSFIHVILSVFSDRICLEQCEKDALADPKHYHFLIREGFNKIDWIKEAIFEKS